MDREQQIQFYKDKMQELESYKDLALNRTNSINAEIDKQVTAGLLDSTEEWTARRITSIGGSEVGTILGVNKYSSAHKLHLTKVAGYKPEISDKTKIAFKCGHLLEPVVEVLYKDLTHEECQTSPTLFNKDFWWLTCSLDRVVVDKKGKVKKILEIKSASFNSTERNADGTYSSVWGEGNQYNKNGKCIQECDQIPESYKMQVMTYMLVTGIKVCDVAALINTNDFRVYTIHFDELLGYEIAYKTKKFFCENVLDGKAPTHNHLDIMSGDSYVMVADNQLLKAFELLSVYKKDAAEVKAKIEYLENQIKGYIDTRESVVYEGKEICTFKQYQGKVSFDLNKFVDENPGLVDLVNKYQKQGKSYKRLVIREKDIPTGFLNESQNNN